LGGREFEPHSNYSHVKPKTLKWVVIAPLPRAHHLEVRIMGVSDNVNKSRVLVGVGMQKKKHPKKTKLSLLKAIGAKHK
jgi:hypothetical protein